ncbi:unnamed protein product [Caenorhabditis brenneri]
MSSDVAEVPQTINTEDPPPPQGTARSAKIHVENKTSDPFKVQIIHKYTGEPVQDSRFELLHPGDKKLMLKVTYTTGFWTTGVDNWKVHAVKLIETGEYDEDGNKMYKPENWRTGHSLADDWKKHTLRSEDDDKETWIRLYKNEVVFDSPSGTSTSEFKKGEYEGI